MRPSVSLVATLLFGSGMAALMYQTAWQRMFRLTFGASTAASAAVLGIFLGGLGIGSYWLGRRAERSTRPLSLYGNLEVGVALSAATSPFVLEVLSRVYLWLGGTPALGTFGATLARLVIAALVIGPPVVLMGGTLPAAARAVEVVDDRSRGRLANLYGVNTAGAVFGAVMSTFVLFELLGTRRALWLAALINLLIAMWARSKGRALEDVPVSAGSAGASPPQREDGGAERSLPSVLIYLTAGAVGFVFLGQELVWYRMLAPILGGTSFTFGLVLAVALAGIGLGGFLYAKRGHDRPATGVLLAATLAIEAVFVALPLALGDELAMYTSYTRSMASLGFAALVFTWTITCAVTVLPAAVISGYQFPVIFGLLGQGRAGVAEQVGRAYAANTIGSIAGALLGGFYFIPHLGAVGTWRAMTWLLAGFALVTLAWGLRSRAHLARRSSLSVLLAATCGFLLATAEGPTAAWRHTAIGAGRAQVPGKDRNSLEDWKLWSQQAVLWERDGVESTVGLRVSYGVTFIVNGKSDGAVDRDRGTQTMLGLLPALLHGDPKKAFVLGLGTGMTAGWLAELPSIEKVDVAELEPAILDVARASRTANHEVLQHPKVDIFLGDGREFLLTSAEKFDLIVSEPSNPFRAGVASLFTRDFYEVVDSKLADEGIFAQWLQGYEVDAATIRMALRTIHAVFEHVEIWHTQTNDLVFVAAHRRLQHDVERIRRQVAEEPFRTALPRTWYVDDAEGVFAYFLADAELSGAIAEALDSPINTDDNGLLEYAFARQVGSKSLDTAPAIMKLAVQTGHHRPQVVGQVDWPRVDEQRARGWLVAGSRLPSMPGISDEGSVRLAAIGRGCGGQAEKVMELWARQPRQEPRDTLERFVVAQGLAHQQNSHAQTLAARLHGDGFEVEAAFVRAVYHRSNGNNEAAVDAVEAGIVGARRQPLGLCRVEHKLISLAERLAVDDPSRLRRIWSLLVEAPLAAHIADDNRLRVAQELAFRAGDPEMCVKAMGKHLERPRWTEAFLRNRYRCLATAKHALADRAGDELIRFVRQSQGDLGEGLELPGRLAAP